MRRRITGHTYKNNGAAFNAGIVTKRKKGVPACDVFYIEFKTGKGERQIFYIRPDEVVLIIKILSELILKRVITYKVNLGRKTKLDY